MYHRPLGPKAPKIGTNEWLRIGSTFHSLHAIAAEASPLKLPGNKNSSKYVSYFDCFYCDSESEWNLELSVRKCFYVIGKSMSTQRTHVCSSFCLSETQLVLTTESIK